jgi:hypothetical protein
MKVWSAKLSAFQGEKFAPNSFEERGRNIRRKDGERRCDDQVIVAASRLQSETASCGALEHEAFKLAPQQLAAGYALGNCQFSAPHGGAEPLDQPRLANNQAVSLRWADERSIAADQADTNASWVFRQQFCSGVAEAALIEDEEVEPGEVRRDQRELFAQRSLRQAKRRTDGEPAGLVREEHERAVVGATGEIKAGDRHAKVSSLVPLTWWPGDDPAMLLLIRLSVKFLISLVGVQGFEPWTSD